MIIGFTGVRPQKMGGFSLPNPTFIRVSRELDSLLRELKPEKCISGMAQGFDLLAANVCVNLGIPFVAAIPFLGQENLWPEKSKKHYQHFLNKAAETVIVCDGGFASWKFQKRNEFIVLNCDLLISCSDGSPGGTMNTIQFAEKIGREKINIDPKETK